MIRQLVLPWINGNLIKPIPLFCCSFKDHIFVHLQALAKFYCQWSIIVQRSVCLQLTRVHKLKNTPISSLKSVSIHLKISVHLQEWRNVEQDYEAKIRIGKSVCRKNCHLMRLNLLWPVPLRWQTNKSGKKWTKF